MGSAKVTPSQYPKFLDRIILLLSIFVSIIFNSAASNFKMPYVNDLKKNR